MLSFVVKLPVEIRAAVCAACEEVRTIMGKSHSSSDMTDPEVEFWLDRFAARGCQQSLQ